MAPKKRRKKAPAPEDDWKSTLFCWRGRVVEEEGKKVTVVESFTWPQTNTVALKRAATGVDGLAEQALRDVFAETEG